MWVLVVGGAGGINRCHRHEMCRFQNCQVPLHTDTRALPRLPVCVWGRVCPWVQVNSGYLLIHYRIFYKLIKIILNFSARGTSAGVQLCVRASVCVCVCVCVSNKWLACETIGTMIRLRYLHW